MMAQFTPVSCLMFLSIFSIHTKDKWQWSVIGAQPSTFPCVYNSVDLVWRWMFALISHNAHSLKKLHASLSHPGVYFMIQILAHAINYVPCFLKNKLNLKINNYIYLNKSMLITLIVNPSSFYFIFLNNN